MGVCELDWIINPIWMGNNVLMLLLYVYVWGGLEWCRIWLLGNKILYVVGGEGSRYTNYQLDQHEVMAELRIGWFVFVFRLCFVGIGGECDMG